ncbi:hypothetical protein [Vreelandella sulfidaeris]|uniref:Uncharacterized protein n=1 Tax=Vreelandella sulfidaeris TaxID=115553 RepID=A0A455U634_9GAMM|nr:hypothetical protein HSBAA_29260 [Halomonas sulfidaeris]
MPGRIEQIANDLIQDDGKAFYCHKTLSGSRDHDEDGEEGEHYQPGSKDSVCAGSLIFQLKVGRVPIIARLAFSAGLIDYKGLQAQFSDVIDPDDVL